MKKIFFTFFCFLFKLNFLGQEIINFTPKKLYIEINKISNIKNPYLLEITELSNIYQGKYYKIDGNSEIKYVYVGRVNTCRAGGCKIDLGISANTHFEFFDYFIIYDSTIKIKKITVFNYEATRGQEITVKGWLNQFIGYEGSYDLIVGKNINAISGATISTYSITNDIIQRTFILKNYVNTGKYK